MSPPSSHMVSETDTWEANPAWSDLLYTGAARQRGRGEGGAGSCALHSPKHTPCCSLLAAPHRANAAMGHWACCFCWLLIWESTDGKEAEEGSSLLLIQEYRETRNLASFFLVVTSVPNPGNSCFLKTLQVRLPTRCQELLVPAYRYSCFRAYL